MAPTDMNPYPHHTTSEAGRALWHWVLGAGIAVSTFAIGAAQAPARLRWLAQSNTSQVGLCVDDRFAVVAATVSGPRSAVSDDIPTPCPTPPAVRDHAEADGNTGMSRDATMIRPGHLILMVGDGARRSQR